MVKLAYEAAVLEAPGRIAIREQRIEGRLLPGEALLEVIFAGVCGTDVAMASGDYPVPLPLIPGHEIVARVADAPARSPAAKLIGQAVACEINNSCAAYGRKRLCEACRRGLSTHCSERTVTGIIQHAGAFARYLRAPAGNLHPIPKKMPLDTAVLIEPLAAAIRTFELSPIRGGEVVVVLGCGRLGRLISLVASSLGARVIAVGRSVDHLTRIAETAWARVRYQGDGSIPGVLSADTPEELREIVHAKTRGLGADIVVEATGKNENLRLAQRLARPLGTIAMKSTSGVPVSGFDATGATVNELRFQSSRCGPFDKAIAFIEEHGAPSASWITARFSLDRAADAIAAAAREPKVILEISPP